MREAANRFCSILAHLFNDDALDRKTLWSRIDSALSTACAKVTDDDLDRFVSLCLEHVQADPAEAARCEALGQMLAVFDEANRPPEWRQAFLDHINTHRFAVLAHGRARWERVKAKEVDL